jgi:anti-anti-sigma factor
LLYENRLGDPKIEPIVYPGLIELDALSAGATTIVTVVGELDLSTVATLRDFVGRLLQRDQTIVLDLTGVPFMDSTGLGAIVALFNRARRDNGWVVLRNPRPEVSRVLELTAVDTLIPVERDE